MSSAFAEHVAIWDRLAEEDPFWAVLSDPAMRGGGWEPDAFFATGRSHIERLELELQELGHSFAGRRALDFGCGLGRLTQAIGSLAAVTVGVDASVGMVLGAQRWNRTPDRCAYLLNRSPDLTMLADGSFGAVVSFIALQHIPPPASHRYLSELARLVGAGGFLVVQVPAEEVVSDLPAAGFRCRIRLIDVPEVVEAGAGADVVFEVANTSGAPWRPRPLRRLRAGNHWVPLDGGPSVRDDRRVGLDPLAPGAVATVRLPVVAPSHPGRYRLEVDLVVEGQSWFADEGGTPAAAEVHVIPRRRVFHPRSGGPPGPPAAATFGMFCVAKADVVRLLEAAGLRVLQAAPDDSSGDQWHSWRYVATRP